MRGVKRIYIFSDNNSYKLVSFWFVMTKRSTSIKNTSQELVLEAFRTLPMEPEQSNITLLADGVSIPYRNDSDQVKKAYDETCRERGIIPGSGIVWEIHNDILRPTQPAIGSYKPERVFSGGRINQIRIEGGFNFFRDNLLEEAVSNGYKVSWADLALTTYHLTGYNQGDYPDTILQFGAGIESLGKGLNLIIGSHIERADADKLRDWFRGLDLKYNPKQPALMVLVQ